jgi:hypothetical protein
VIACSQGGLFVASSGDALAARLPAATLTVFLDDLQEAAAREHTAKISKSKGSSLSVGLIFWIPLAS